MTPNRERTHGSLAVAAIAGMLLTSDSVLAQDSQPTQPPSQSPEEMGKRLQEL